MESELRSRSSVIAELEAKKSDINVKLLTATPEQKLVLLEDLNRVGQSLALERELSQEVITGKIVGKYVERD